MRHYLHERLRHHPLIIVAGLAALLLSAGCGGADRTQVEPRDPAVLRLASFDFPENRMLAELYGEHLRQAGFRVEVLSGLGTREVVAPALQQGLVDLVIDYTGSLLDYAGGSAAQTHGTPEAVRTALADRLSGRGLSVLRSAPAEDANGFAVRTAFARDNGLTRLSDLRALAGRLTFGGPPECPKRRYCLQGLQATYGLNFTAFRPQLTREATATALETGEIDVGLLETTYGRLVDRAVTLLTDDRALQPRENVVPIVRTEVVRSHGARLTDALDRLSARLDTIDLIRLNQSGAVDPRSPADVAAAYLSNLGG
jgi:osmoprotectant transport system substrate-binding protein